MSVLELEGVSCGYGASVVVRDLDLHVDGGEVVAVLGANGAGKTTTLLTIAGVLPAAGGQIRFLGERIERWPAPRIARHCAALVPDDRGLFPKLTVRENLALSAPRKRMADDPLALFPELHARLSTPAGLLSGGQQQMLAIARALQRSPKLLLVDELSFGLAPVIVQRLVPVLRRVADETGAAVVLVEQHVHLGLAVAERAYVLSHGSLVLTAPAAELRDNMSLLEASYLGEGNVGAAPGQEEPMSTSQTSDTPKDDMALDDVVDVAIVGYGPVGATLAVLLAQRGWRVVVVERWAEPYPMPRAVHFDHEAGRILQSCGIGEALAKISEPADIYEFQNAARKPLVRFGRVGSGLSGWPQSSMFSQPELEALLFERVGELPGIEVRRGVQVTAIEDDGGAGVTVHGEGVDIEPDGNGGLRLRTTGVATPVRTRYVVGCDGANSTVRNVLGLEMTDRAFFYDWLIVDVIFDEPRTYDPLNVQICDPARPTTCVSGGPGRRRWEFMALPGESIDDLNDEATAWRLLEPWDASPKNARLERHAVYRFQARWVQEWRRGRVLLAGDAAHQTPPFAGQGLCSGLRDAANLAWKLDRVLTGTSPDTLLDAYGIERAPNMEAVIELAIQMGKMICACDPDEVRARDDMFLAVDDRSTITEIPPFPGISEGIMIPGTPRAGELFVQADVARDGVRMRFDDAVGAGWRLVTDGKVAVDCALAQWFTSIDGAVVAVGGESGLTDVDGVYARWFAEQGVIAALQRPDFVLFGTAEAPSDVDGLLRALQGRLTGR